MYLKLKRPAEAESKFRASLNADPNSTVAALGLAQTLDAEGKPEAADAYRKYLTLQPSDQTARARVIHFLVEQQNYDEALAELDRADKDKPPSSDTLRLRADIQIAQKHFDDAIVTLQRAIALTPKDRNWSPDSAAFICRNTTTPPPKSNSNPRSSLIRTT